MADFTLKIETNDPKKCDLIEPNVLDGVTLEQDRTGSPSKLTFTVLKDTLDDISIMEGARVCFWYKDVPLFMGYVFTKKRDRERQIQIVAYDQLRYFKNKFTYVFSKKTATDIIKQMCDDFGLKAGTLENTNYVIPSLVEENKTLFDITSDALDETVLNTGTMYTLYDNFGSIELKSLDNMKTSCLINQDTAENFDYTSSIDSETYNKIILYYKPQQTQQTSVSDLTSSSGGGGGGSVSSEVVKIINTALAEVGVREQGLNVVKYNTEYYGNSVATSSRPWCCVFVWWVFTHAGLSNLFYGGGKTAACATLRSWFNNQGRLITDPKKFQVGDIVFFDAGGPSNYANHVGIIESVGNNGTFTTIEGNTSNKVGRRSYSVHYDGLMGAGRPAYGSGNTRAIEPRTTTSGNLPSITNEASEYQWFYAKDDWNIKNWGLLQYFESVSNPSIGQSKANSLLKMYNRKTRELSITGAFGNPEVRAGSLIVVQLDLGDIITSHYMLVEKVTHKFENDHYTMDLTINGYWGD